MKLAKFVFAPTIVAISLALCAALSSFGAFRYETTLTVDGYKEAATLENFPLLVRISSARISGFSYSLCQSDGKDIQFTSEDGKTTYPHEIDEWNTGDGEESLVWVRVPLSAGLKLKMKFGDSDVSAAPSYVNDGTVWSAANYFSVYHMNECGGQEETVEYYAYDSSGNDFTLTPKGGASGMISKIGPVGRSRQTATTGGWAVGRLEGSDYDSLGVGDTFTVSGWIQCANSVNGALIFTRKNSMNDANGWIMQQWGTTSLYFLGASNFNNNYMPNTKVDFTANSIYVTAVYDGTSLTLYANGSKIGTGTIVAATDNGKPFRIGNCNGGTGAGVTVDEVRLQDACVTAEWAAADYGCQAIADYVTASKVTEAVSDNYVAVTAEPKEFPVEGIAYGNVLVSPGQIRFEAPAEAFQVGEGTRCQISGWELTITDADGGKSVTSGKGAVCVGTFPNGGVGKLVWKFDTLYNLTVASADDSKGTVSEGGYVAAGAEVVLTAEAADGYEFYRWVSSELEGGKSRLNPISVVVDKPIALTAEFVAAGLANAYHWKTSTNGNWVDAGNWEEGEAPVDDDMASVVFPGDKDYTVTLPASGAVAKSIRIESPAEGASGGTVSFGGGKLTVGSGGLAFDKTSGSVGLQFVQTSKLVIDCSQVWDVTSCKNAKSVIFYGAVEMESEDGAGVPRVWTIAGLSSVYCGQNFSSSDIRGKVRMNIKYMSTYDTGKGVMLVNAGIKSPGVLELFDDDSIVAGATSISIDQTAQHTATDEWNVVSSPLAFDLTEKRATFKLPVNSCQKARAWDYRITSSMRGRFADRNLVFSSSDGSGDIKVHLPFKQRVYLTGDGSGLIPVDGARIGLSTGLFTLASPNALGEGNSIGVWLGGGSQVGFIGGLMTSDGVDVASDIDIPPAQANRFMFGLLDPGVAHYTGDFSTCDLASNKRAQLFLNAAKGAEVHFGGDFDLSSQYDLPLEIMGGGTVFLEGDNTKIGEQPVVVRSAKLVLGNDTAAGAGTIRLGGETVTNVTVTAVCDGSFTFIDGKYNASKVKLVDGYTDRYVITGDFTFDGVAMKEGDTFLYIPWVYDSGRIFKVVSENEFVVLPLPYSEGMRINVAEGETYAGMTFRMLRGATPSTEEKPEAGTGDAIPDVTDPEIAVLAQGARMIANDIVVDDNKSDSVRTIGGVTADESTFSGDITINAGVVFAAVKGGVVNVTGVISNEGGFNVGFAGLGTVNFAQRLDIEGKAITVRLPVDGVPTEGSMKYVLATGLSGTPASVTVVTDDGSAVPGEWTARVVGSKLVFRNKPSGFGVIVR